MLIDDKDQMCNIEEVLIKCEKLKEGNMSMIKYDTTSVDNF